MFTPEQIAALSANLDRKHVANRSQSGRTLSYLEGWWCISEANRIFGFDGWERETLETRCVAERERKVGSVGQDGWGVSYVARVRVTVILQGPEGHSSILRDGTGAGHGIDRDLGLAHESAIKEAETDALKRCLMTFGNPFGLALYDKTQANVGIVQQDEPPPLSSFAAKKLTGGEATNMGERFNELKHEIADLESVSAILGWIQERTPEIKTMPLLWQKTLRAELDTQRGLVSAPESIEAEA